MQKGRDAFDSYRLQALVSRSLVDNDPTVTVIRPDRGLGKVNAVPAKRREPMYIRISTLASRESDHR
jgi:hypothetical protein